MHINAFKHKITCSEALWIRIIGVIKDDGLSSGKFKKYLIDKLANEATEITFRPDLLFIDYRVVFETYATACILQYFKKDEEIVRRYVDDKMFGVAVSSIGYRNPFASYATFTVQQILSKALRQVFHELYNIYITEIVPTVVFDKLDNKMDNVIIFEEN